MRVKGSAADGRNKTVTPVSLNLPSVGPLINCKLFFCSIYNFRICKIGILIIGKNSPGIKLELSDIFG